jgi:predicted Zn-dependent protease
MISYYAAISASSANMHDRSVKLFENLKDKNYQMNSVYQNLAAEYLSVKDTANYLKTLQEGIEKLPKQSWYMQNLINFYIHTNKIKDALVYLNAAIEREPLFSQYQFVKGQLYLTLENFDEANKALNKAIEMDPTNPDIYAELGRSYYNKAVKMSIEANKIKDTNTYKKEEAKVDEVFKEAIPFYKKAIELKPKEVEYKLPLKQLYYRLQMDSEYEAINKDIKAL